MMKSLGPHFLICKIGVTVYAPYDCVKIKYENKYKALSWYQEELNKSVYLKKDAIKKVLNRTGLFTTKSWPRPALYSS